jgi:hypothetical protein
VLRNIKGCVAQCQESSKDGTHALQALRNPHLIEPEEASGVAVAKLRAAAVPSGGGLSKHQRQT